MTSSRNHQGPSTSATRRQGLARVGRSAPLVAALLLAALLAACGGKRELAAGAVAAAAGADHAQHVVATMDHADHAEHTEHAAPADAAAPSVDDPHAGHEGHAGHQAALPATELPGTSIYHLTGAFQGQDGHEFRLGELRGAPVVVVMFYGDCTTACPLLVKSAQDIEAALPPELAAEARFAMVSFDTARDTPDKLRAYADSLGLDKSSWHWLVGSPLLTRQLATLLGVQYRDAGNGVFAHSNLVTVLDADGVPSARVEGLGAPLEPAVAAIRAALE